MAEAIRFEGCNTVLKAPAGRDDVADMFGYSYRNGFVACWQLTPEELEEINRTGCVYVSIMGSSIPPSFVGSRSSVRSVTVDYGGIW